MSTIDMRTWWTLYFVLAPLLLVGVPFMFGPGGSYDLQVASRCFVLILWVGSVLIGCQLSINKGRDPLEGAVLGTLGPLGLVIEILLPPRGSR
jgi:hypothetical protein